MSREDDLSFLAPPGEVADWRMVATFDAAAEAGLFEQLPATPAQVASRLGLDERAVRILLGALSVWGVVERHAGRYSMHPDWSCDQGEAATLRHHARVLRTWSTQLGDRLRGTPPSPSKIPPERRRLWLEALAARASRLRSSSRPASSVFRTSAASWTSEEVTANTPAPSPGGASA